MRIANMSSRSIILIALIGCGGNNQMPSDAMHPDARVIDNSCGTYCAAIQADCTGPNAQYTGTDSVATQQSCLNTCLSFAKGASTINDTSGNTLGCRVHYAVDASNAPFAECVAAGPAGDQISASPALCSGGDTCISFCTLEIQFCGSLDAPLPGDPEDSIGNPLFQYQNMADCMTQCASFDKTHPYSTTATGNSLACRLLHSTLAATDASSAAVHCASTAMTPRENCTGTASP